MTANYDLSWSINSPGQNIRFTLIKWIFSKYVGHNKNNVEYYLYKLTFFRFIFTCTDMFLNILRHNKQWISYKGFVNLSVVQELLDLTRGGFRLIFFSYSQRSHMRDPIPLLKSWLKELMNHFFTRNLEMALIHWLKPPLSK